MCFPSFRDMNLTSYCGFIRLRTIAFIEPLFLYWPSVHLRLCVSFINIKINDIKGALLGLRQFLTIESPPKMMKNAFLFHLKNCFRSQDI